MRPPTGNKITQGQHNSTKSVDYSHRPDANIYAPEDGTIDSYQKRGSGKLDAGNCLRLRGKSGKLHQFAHCSKSLVSTGQRVSKGQAVAVMGNTGYAFGVHLHYWVQNPNGTYTYPPSQYTEPFAGNPAPPTPQHSYKGLVGKVIEDTDFFRAWERNTDKQMPYRLKGRYIVRDVSQRGNRVVVYSSANGGLVDQALATPAGAEYSGWKVI